LEFSQLSTTKTIMGYDYVVGVLLRRQLKFSIPNDFSVGEISISEELEGVEDAYREWLLRELDRIGRRDLLNT
jgi:hypothetical protein